MSADCIAADENITDVESVHVQLVKDGEVINSLESFVNATFNVQFVNLQGKDTIAFECVWKRNNTRFCEQKVTVDLQKLPAPVQEVALSVLSFDTLMHFSKMIVVSFKDSQKNYKEMKASTQVTVAKYGIKARSCAVTSKLQPSLSETRFCFTNGSTFACGSFMKRNIFSPRVVVATVKVKNQAGSCYSGPFCKQFTYFDIYGGLENVTVDFDIVNLNVRLLVSWKIPHGIQKLAGRKVVISIKYCIHQCWYKNFTKNAVPAKIDKNIAYNSTYIVQVRYIYSDDFWYPSVSPWTQPVSIRIPNQVPTKSPEILKCESNVQGLIIVWRSEHVEFYELKYEESGRNDSYLKFPAKNCTQDHCEFALKRKPIERSFGITVLPCSDSGCNSKSISSCYFTKRLPIGKSSAPKRYLSLQTYELLLIIVPLVVIGFVFIAVIVVITRAFKCKKKISSSEDVNPIGPRPYADYAQVSIVHHEYQSPNEI